MYRPALRKRKEFAHYAKPEVPSPRKRDLTLDVESAAVDSAHRGASPGDPRQGGVVALDNATQRSPCCPRATHQPTVRDSSAPSRSLDSVTEQLLSRVHFAQRPGRVDVRLGPHPTSGAVVPLGYMSSLAPSAETVETDWLVFSPRRARGSRRVTIEDFADPTHRGGERMPAVAVWAKDMGTWGLAWSSYEWNACYDAFAFTNPNRREGDDLPSSPLDLMAHAADKAEGSACPIAVLLRTVASHLRNVHSSDLDDLVTRSSHDLSWSHTIRLYITRTIESIQVAAVLVMLTCSPRVAQQVLTAGGIRLSLRQIDQIRRWETTKALARNLGMWEPRRLFETSAPTGASVPILLSFLSSGGTGKFNSAGPPPPPRLAADSPPFADPFCLPDSVRFNWLAPKARRGRPRSLKPAAAVRLRDEGLRHAEIARRLSITVATSRKYVCLVRRARALAISEPARRRAIAGEMVAPPDEVPT